VVDAIEPPHTSVSFAFCVDAHAIAFPAEFQDVAFLQIYLLLLPVRGSDVDESVAGIFFSRDGRVGSSFPEVEAICVRKYAYILRFR
jgi:hypothetical protein